MSTTVQKIKERLGIIDVIASYIDVEKSGSNFKAKCPFHHEKTPSFYISPERQSYYCFGCAVKGDIFTFVQEFEGVDFVTSLKMLADRAGVVIEKFEKNEVQNNASIYDILEETTKFFQNNLKDNNEALIYIKKRNLSIESLRTWRLGLALNDWRSLKEHLSHLGFSNKEMMDAGLIKENEKGESYDRFRDRIMFPIFDTAGRTIAFTGRIIHPKDEEAKYLNSPDTELFDKSKTLYGYNIAKTAIRLNQSVILVEGQMDLLMSHQAGLKNTVASSGTALTTQHLEILRRLTDTLIIAYDADNAGRSATIRAWKLALVAGFTVKVAFLPDGLDPADAVAKDAEIWKLAVKDSQNIIDYFLENMKGENDRSIADKTLKEKVLPLVKSIQSAIDRSRFLQKASFISGVSEGALIEELNRIKDEDLGAREIPLPNKSAHSNIPSAIGFYLYLKTKNSPEVDNFKIKLLEIDKNFEERIPKEENEKGKILFEMELQYGEGSNLKAVMNELLRHFEEETLKIDFAKTMENMKKLEALRDIDAINKELARTKEISQKLSGLAKKYAST
ncbi:MAG: dnaG [Candidatus Taylorbacteria bacterium]|nr:dnaG [Candidatus Taylorbacteria bacterium]